MDNKSKQRVVMISFDATGKRDMEYLMSLPNFKKHIENGAFCDTTYSVYPSLTYPAHASIVTGLTPDHHRIVGNKKLQPSRNNPDWFYKRKYIRGTTIVDEAHKHGYKTAAFLWPVMGGANIEYNIPEVLVTRKFQTQVTACLANGTPKFLLECNKKFGHIRKGISQPALDDFIMACVEYTIEKYDPDFMLIHLTDVDTNRHDYGIDAPEIKKALERHDERLGKIYSLLEKKRPMDKTTVIVLGDHCQVDMHTVVYLNKLFSDKGYLTVKNGKITDYRVIAKSCDGSAYIYLNPKESLTEAFLEELTDLLNEMKNDERLGIETIFTREEAAQMGADSECFVMIEGKPGYYFLNDFDVLTKSVDELGAAGLHATHGCLPTKEDNITFFSASGYGIKKGARNESMHLWDEGPTIAKLMGFELKNVDGRVLSEILDL